MRKLVFLWLWLVVGGAANAKSDMEKASRALLERVVKAGADRFVVEEIPATSAGKDVFEIESRGRKIVLRGNSPVAVASGLNWYLKYFCRRQVSWNHFDVDLPDPLPAVTEKVRRETAYNDRSYMNYCTFSYTAAFWDWDRWQKEIDWMALHGITMPLAVTGQEAVWYNTLLRFGMTDEEIRQFLCGPAFFAWQWMTNIESWGGPLPRSWIDRSVELGRKIVERERELGMRPVLQGFTGYVPLKLKEKFPEADIAVKPFWLRYFPPGTAQLDPLDPLFAEIGKAFLEEQEKLFGTDHLYAADPFHEGNPPKTYDGYLKEVGEALFATAQAVDPDAVIVMQSWSFRPDIAFAIPADRLLVFDLNSSRSKSFDYFKGRAWHGGVIHNFGGTVAMGGNLEQLARRLCIEGKDSTWKNYVGFGLFPEATENNPVVYELASEMAWHPVCPDMSAWVADYARARYGSDDRNMLEAWQVLLRTVYGKKRGVTLAGESPICARPHLDVYGASPNSVLTPRNAYDFSELWKAPQLMLRADAGLRNHPNYRYDLTDAMRQCLSDLSILVQERVADAYRAGDRQKFETETARFLELILDMDELLATDESFTLGRWIAQARACGRTDEEKALYEKNARWLVTVWGPYDKDAMLFDYSNRQWAGLFRDYYYRRWQKYFDFLRSELAKPEQERYVETRKIHHRFFRPANEANDFYRMISRWEYEWCEETKPYPAEAVGDTYTVASKLFGKWKGLAAELYRRPLEEEGAPRTDMDKGEVVFGID